MQPKSTAGFFTRQLRRVLGLITASSIRASVNGRDANQFRPALVQLGERVVPATWVWQGSDGNFDNPMNWFATGTEQNGVPGAGDDLVFDGVIGSGTGVSNFHGPASGSYDSISLQDEYPGNVHAISGFSTNLLQMNTGSFVADGPITAGSVTVGGGALTVSTALNTGSLQLSGGEIDQPNDASVLTATGNFNWTGGILNNTPSNANVNIDGGGSITLPGDGNTMSAGSTLNFGNTDTSGNTLAMTTISGGGTLLLNGLNPNAINAQPNAGVLVATEVTSPGKLKGVNNGTTLTISEKSYWGYIGNGVAGAGATAELDVAVVNNGGYFFVGTTGGQDVKAQAVPNIPAGAGLSTVTLTINSGANTVGYTQQTSANGILEINAGCTLDVSKTTGVSISKGAVQLTPNPNLIMPATQISTIAGNFTFSGDSIGFAGGTVNVANKKVFVHFAVTKDVTWTGGSFVPGIDSTNPSATGDNQWNITGTLTIDSTKGGTPAVIVTPNGGMPPAARLWPNVITSGKLAVVKNAPFIIASDPTKDTSKYTLPTDNKVNGYDIGT